MAADSREPSWRGVSFPSAAPRMDQYLAKEKLLNPPYHGASQDECTYYYWWWQFLRHHPGYRATCEAGGRGAYAALYADLGDVLGNDFRKWFASCGRVQFANRKTISLITAEQAESYKDGILIAITPGLPMVSTLQTVQKLLRVAMRRRARAIGSGSRGPAPLATTLAKYPVVGRPSLQNLYWALQVWKADRQPTRKLSDPQLAHRIGIAYQDEARARQRISELRRQAGALMTAVARVPRVAARCPEHPGLLSVFPKWL